MKMHDIDDIKFCTKSNVELSDFQFMECVIRSKLKTMHF